MGIDVFRSKLLCFKNKIVFQSFVCIKDSDCLEHDFKFTL